MTAPAKNPMTPLLLPVNASPARLATNATDHNAYNVRARAPDDRRSPAAAPSMPNAPTRRNPAAMFGW